LSVTLKKIILLQTIINTFSPLSIGSLSVTEALEETLNIIARSFSPLSIGSLSVTTLQKNIFWRYGKCFQSPFYRVFECNPPPDLKTSAVARTFSPLSIGSLSVTVKLNGRTIKTPHSSFSPLSIGSLSVTFFSTS